MYKTYKLDMKNRMSVRSSTDGYQPKFLVDNGANFLKVQCQIGRTLRDDWRVEQIASIICNQLGIYAVHQTPCRIILRLQRGRIAERMGVVSRNFEVDDICFVSFDRLLELNRLNIDSEFVHADSIQKLNMIVAMLCRLCNLSVSESLSYVYSMATVDMLVLNQDRHLKNFGIFYNKRTRLYSVAKLFDFGMGLFENDNSFDVINNLDDALRYSYIAPYGDDPFELASMLLNIDQYRAFLKSINISKLKIDSRLFPNKLGLEYFKKMKRVLINGSRV